MKNIESRHKIHKRDKNTEKLSSKKDWLYFLELNICLFLAVFCSHFYSILCDFD